MVRCGSEYLGCTEEATHMIYELLSYGREAFVVYTCLKCKPRRLQAEKATGTVKCRKIRSRDVVLENGEVVTVERRACPAALGPKGGA